MNCLYFLSSQLNLFTLLLTRREVLFYVCKLSHWQIKKITFIGASWHCKRCVDQRYRVAAAENRALKRSDLLRFKGGQQRRQQQELTPPCDVGFNKIFVIFSYTYDQKHKIFPCKSIFIFRLHPLHRRQHRMLGKIRMRYTVIVVKKVIGLRKYVNLFCNYVSMLFLNTNK